MMSLVNRGTIALLVSVALPGCDDPAPGTTPGQDEVPTNGDRCATRRDRCLDDGNVMVCEEGVWRLQDCEDYCLPNLEPLGCVVVSSDATHCECGDPIDQGDATTGSDPPGPPPQSCLDARTLRQCSGTDGCVVVVCDELCAAAGQQSAGCYEGLEHEDSATCMCTFGGTPCPQPAGPRCDGNDTLAVCVEGEWRLRACVDCPEPAVPACRLGDDGTSACVCVDGS